MGKFESLLEIIQDNIDILAITETKLDESYTTNMLDIEGYSLPYRRDRNVNGGGVLVYIKEGILCRELKTKPSAENLEGIFLEINLRKTKWLFFAGYNNCKPNIGNFLRSIGPTMCRLENLILLGDFNSELTEYLMKEFCDTYNLKNLVTEATCFKNPLNPSSIDLILTNRIRSFQNTITLETGLSDHHKMVITVLKTFIPKRTPILIKYRDYRKFNSQNFRQDLQNNIANISDEICYEIVESTFKEILNKHAPIKTKKVRANNSPNMNKTLSKAIMNRSRLKNKFQKNPNYLNKLRYKQQRNYCVNLTRRVKKQYYSNLDITNVTDNKKFWDTIKPSFSNKNASKKKITLIEGETIITDDAKLAATFNTLFSNGINEKSSQYDTGDVSDITLIITKFKDHPSVTKIKEYVNDGNKFSFTLSSLEDMKNRINNLNTSKPTTYNNIPAKILVEFSDICSEPIQTLYNKSILDGNFPDALKLADITPSHKKYDKCLKENYRPISILSSFSKIFEKTMHDDIYRFMDNKLSPYLCGFRKGYSTQYCLLVMLERFKKALDNKNKFGALLTDLSKAFDCLNHELIIAKLEAYGFDYVSLNVILSYLTGRKHRTKINNCFSEWADIMLGVPQGSILGPLLFNIYINDIFYFVREDRITNYADDTTPYTINKNYVEMVDELQLDAHIVELVQPKLFKIKP